MPNKELDKTGGRQYPYTWTQTTPGTTMHVCDEDGVYGLYRSTGTEPVNTADPNAYVPPDPTYDSKGYNKRSHIAIKPADAPGANIKQQS